jgi:hypothetical protein
MLPAVHGRRQGSKDMEHMIIKPAVLGAHFRSAKRAALFASLILGLSSALLSAIGCGGAGGSGPGAAQGDSTSSEGDEVAAPNSVVNKSGSGSVSAVFGSPGGSLSLASGAKVEIPPGAIEGAQEIVLRESQMTTAFYNQESERPIGPTFTISPGFNAPEGRKVVVSIPLAAYPEGYGEIAIAYEYSKGARVGAEDSEHTRWQYENARLSGGRAIAELPGINGYRLQFVVTNLEAQ